MKKVILLFLFLSLSTIYSQDVDSTLNKWTPSLIASANLSQVAFSNWSTGGENSISYSFGVDWVMAYKSSSKWTFKNQLKGDWGQSKIGEDISKVTSNNAFNETVFLYDAGWIVEPYASNLIRTPITNGYNYEAVPEEQIAAFFDPGYVTQSIGFAYEKSEIFQTRIGLAFEESFADKFAMKYTDDPETSGEIEKFKFETGIESITDVKYEVFENVLYKGKLRLFSGFDRLDTWDVAMDNTVTAKVNDWLNVNFTYLIVYKVSESIKTQTQQALQVGVVYNLF
ncbi:MAG: DUF3078 domain-containing protein [Melioribacteraceae bacterium]|nr:DUF3078 domain-containing protein [Melioribacteraceae bacterium]